MWGFTKIQEYKSGWNTFPFWHSRHVTIVWMKLNAFHYFKCPQVRHSIRRLIQTITYFLYALHSFHVYHALRATEYLLILFHLLWGSLRGNWSGVQIYAWTTQDWILCPVRFLKRNGESKESFFKRKITKKTRENACLLKTKISEETRQKNVF